MSTILMTEFVTHDVRRFILTRPGGLDYAPGQGVEISINLPEWKDEGRPFTPTSLRHDRVLQFLIKRYPAHGGVTAKLHTLEPGTEILISEAFGTIKYKGPGVFIAAGAGVTPFLAILRQLAAEGRLDDHLLLFSNKTAADIICELELRHYLGKRCVFTCTRQRAPGYENRRIDRDFLRENVRHFDQRFYVCGPEGFVEAVKAALGDLGARSDAVVFEE